MNIKDHGKWVAYRPETLPEGAPPNALFARRESDGVDWYDYVNPGDKFAEGSIAMTVHDGIVGAAVTDPTRLWPGNGAVVLEVLDYPSADPQKEFGNRRYDEGGARFVAVSPPVPSGPQGPSLADLEKRIAELEGKR